MPNNIIDLYKDNCPSLESYWRSIILFGKNSASYKFALAESLIELAGEGKTEVRFDELAEPFSKHLCEHLEIAPRQCTNPRSDFLDNCKKFNNGEIDKTKLIDITVEKGFNNVIDAFHIVNGKEIPIEFYNKDEVKSQRKIILTDYLHKLSELPCSENFKEEADSRWNLVETAWELGVNKSLLDVKYDGDQKILFVNKEQRRKDVTSAKTSLNGYQKGKCFYCFDYISVNKKNSDNECDVDHFYPHILKDYLRDVNIDGVWNLVLACQPCNRGPDGKFARVPELKYVERLYRRNEFLIGSHHPLRETIMNQTGQTPEQRLSFIQMVDKRAIDVLHHRWEIPARAAASF